MRRLVLAAVAAVFMGPAAMADQASALKAVKAQPRVVDAVVDNSGNLFASVKPEAKVPWDQFAAQLCGLVRPHQGRIFSVKVVDLTSVTPARKPSEWRRLGESRCAG
jgi:hypothetical protein